MSDTKHRLLKSGALLFAEKGFSGVTVRQICQHADASMNMIHHYFGNKQGLLTAIVEQFSLRVFDTPMRLLDTPARSTEDLSSRIEMLFEATLDAYISERDVLLVVMREHANPKSIQTYMCKFKEFLQQAQYQGWVRKELDPAMITGFMLDRILNQVQFAPWVKLNFGEDLLNDSGYKKRWCKSNIDLLLNGLVE